ncbi:unnamed protein product [Peniophora sp. CBMAI 1063]|nr:unnamed protein product [Peniophora sp. CBMAI 1063]
MHGLRFLENPEHLPQLRLIDLHTEDFDLLSILTSFTSQGPHAVPDRFPALEDVLDARRQAGGLQAIYIHVAEEVALIKAGSIGQTSCKDLQEGTVLESVRRLEAVRGVELVTKSFDIFSI